MICYRDMTFCSAGDRCLNIFCNRRLTDRVRDGARQWWGGTDAPIAMSDFAPICMDYKPIAGEASAHDQD